MKPLLFGGDVPSNLFFFCFFAGARAHDSIFRPTQLVKNIDSKNSHPKCILAVDNFLNDWVKIFCVLSMLPNPCRTNTSAEADHKEEHNMEVVTLNLWWVQVLQFSLRSSYCLLRTVGSALFCFPHEVFSLFSGSAVFRYGNSVR